MQNNTGEEAHDIEVGVFELDGRKYTILKSKTGYFLWDGDSLFGPFANLENLDEIKKALGGKKGCRP